MSKFHLANRLFQTVWKHCPNSSFGSLRSFRRSKPVKVTFSGCLRVTTWQRLGSNGRQCTASRELRPTVAPEERHLSTQKMSIILTKDRLGQPRAKSKVGSSQRNLQRELSEVKTKLIGHFKRLHLLFCSASGNLSSILTKTVKCFIFAFLTSLSRLVTNYLGFNQLNSSNCTRPPGLWPSSRQWFRGGPSSTLCPPSSYLQLVTEVRSAGKFFSIRIWRHFLVTLFKGIQISAEVFKYCPSNQFSF